MGVRPVLLCASRLGPMRRPRYYGLKWPLVAGQGTKLIDKTRYAEVVVEQAWSLEAVALTARLGKKEGTFFPTLVRSILRRRPPVAPSRPCQGQRQSEAALGGTWVSVPTLPVRGRGWHWDSRLLEAPQCSIAGGAHGVC